MVGRSAGKVIEYSQPLDLKVGESAEISARVIRPRTLPDNARVRVSIVAVHSPDSSAKARDVVQQSTARFGWRLVHSFYREDQCVVQN